MSNGRDAIDGIMKDFKSKPEEDLKRKSATESVFPPSEERLDAVIPACGWGGKMYPMTRGMPKTLLPINDAPLLVQILRCLDPRLFKKAYILCNKWHPMVESYVQAFRALDANKGNEWVSVECLPGYADVTRAEALHDLHDKLSDPFLLHYADVLIPELSPDKKVRKLLQFHDVQKWPRDRDAWKEIWSEWRKHSRNTALDTLLLLLVSEAFS